MRLSIIKLIFLLGILQVGCKPHKPSASIQKKINSSINVKIHYFHNITSIYSNIDNFILVTKTKSVNISGNADSAVLTLFIGINNNNFCDSFKFFINKVKNLNIGDTIIKGYITSTIVNSSSTKKGNNLLYYKLINRKFYYTKDDSGKSIINSSLPETILSNKLKFTYEAKIAEGIIVTDNNVIITKSTSNEDVVSFSDSAAIIDDRQKELNKKYQRPPLPPQPPLPTTPTNDYLIANPTLYSYSSNRLTQGKEVYLEIEYQKKKAIDCDSLYITTTSSDKNIIIIRNKSEQMFLYNDSLAHKFTPTLIKLSNSSNQESVKVFDVTMQLMCKTKGTTLLLSKTKKNFHIGQQIIIKP